MKSTHLIDASNLVIDGLNLHSINSQSETTIQVPTVSTPKSLHISARRWFQRTYGNTYHSVTIYLDGKPVFRCPFAYGYGEQWLQTAIDWLRVNGFPDAEYGTRYLREELHGTYDVADVSRKSDL